MAMARILQIVGYQNSGKTTFLENLIAAAASKGLEVGTIKHHGHDGQPALADAGKDTGKHRSSGAKVTTVEGQGLFNLTAINKSWSLQEIVKLYEFFALDLILIEGFKKEAYSKVVFIRSEEDLVLLKTVTNIKCLITRFPLPETITSQHKTFKIVEDQDCINWLLENEVGDKHE
ncbi:molybdopterin-guanine dinucleotide biosynthesis protein B [Metabacillus herbersteinensis]|uniref:Molybdopterin-guanine dinucleotide biosynthesis protein B n=1 Tax=Metabacillus herbersteinensis TaxID=283816 RepID=A0ABV6GAN8_9BACI